MSRIETAGQAVDWLNALVRADAPRGEAALRSSRDLFAALGDPQDDRPAVHIVGTAGKGSVAAIITVGLVAAGERVATHCSPHVYDIRERFTLDGALPAWPHVIAAVRRVAEAADQLDQPPTFFAATSATSIVLGQEFGVDRYVVEAGIGGRVDATNVFSRPDVVTVVTAIGLDHTDVLGATAAEIAAEKAAVLAGRKIVVLGPQASNTAAEVVRRVTASAGARLIEVGAGRDVRAEAVATADAVLRLLGRPPAPSPPVLAGRFEAADLGGRRVILDGAHNPMKLAALASGLDERATLVIAAVGINKPLAACAGAIAVLGGTVIATTFGPGADGLGPRGWPVSALADALRHAGVERVVAAAADDVAAVVRNETEPGDLVVVTGSFLHLGDVRQRLAEMQDTSE